MDGSIALVEFSKPSRRACVKAFEYAHIEVGLKIWFRHRCSACGARGLDVRRAAAAADRPALAAGDVVSLVVDRDAGSVAFAINGTAAGVAKAPPGALTLACSLMFASDAVAAKRRP